MFLKTLLVLALACFVHGIKYDGMRVKFGWSDALAGKEYFFSLPRTVKEAESQGWIRLERPPGPLPDLKLYCPPGYTVCTLHDSSGFIAGLQVALAVDEFESLAIKPEKKFIKWSVPANNGQPAKEFWTATQYFVSEESSKAGAGPKVENGETLQDGGVWVAGLDGKLIRIGATEAELKTSIFKKQNCIPNMGTHYYYNLNKDMKCEDLLPWFALTTDGDLVGTGFQMVGRLTKQSDGYRDWFEKFGGGLKTVSPNAPDCLEDWVRSYGMISMHIYYVDKPWNIRCKAGDSVSPIPALDKTFIKGHRYTSQITDEIKKIFSG